MTGENGHALSDAVILVTGGGSGIGRASAVAAAAAGAKVVVCGRRAEALDAVAVQTGGLAVVADLREHDAAALVVAAAVGAYGRLDGVVSNAGVMIPGRVGELSDDDWQRSIDVNLLAPARVVRAALPHLIAAGGSVVFVSSVAALRAPSAAASYAAAKAGLTMLAQSITFDYAAHGVRSNAVCPGWVRTEMADEEMNEFGAPLQLNQDESYQEVTRLVPQRRPATAEEIAQTVVWLLGPHASYVNGAVLSVDGGASAVDVGTSAYDFEIRPR